jgi:hypothetical protein
MAARVEQYVTSCTRRILGAGVVGAGALALLGGQAISPGIHAVFALLNGQLRHRHLWWWSNRNRPPLPCQRRSAACRPVSFQRQHSFVRGIGYGSIEYRV